VNPIRPIGSGYISQSSQQRSGPKTVTRNSAGEPSAARRAKHSFGLVH
jgi:hypothetical protein